MIALIVSTSAVLLMAMTVIATLWLYRWNVRRAVRRANPPTHLRWISVKAHRVEKDIWLTDDLDWDWPKA